MSKTLKTKRKILNLLKKREMTISGMSEALGLSTATISQHVEDLRNAGAIEKIENEHFRKLKYYRVVQETNQMTAKYVKYVIGVVTLIAIISAIYFYRAKSSPSGPAIGNLGLPTTSSINANTTIATTSPAPRIVSAACPMITYSLNGSFYSYSNMSLHYLNSTEGTIADYVIASGTTGTLHGTEHIYGAMEQQSNTTLTINHYAYLSSVNSSTGMESQYNGINVSIHPSNFIVANGPMNVTVDIAANSTATGTYWLRVDGPCGGGMMQVLITVGNAPYNGSVSQPVSTFA